MEKQMSYTCVIAMGMWVSAVVLIFVGTAVGLVFGQGQMPVVVGLMAHGLVTAAGAATMTVRHMLRVQNLLLRDAFELGRDAASVSPVRAMR